MTCPLIPFWKILLYSFSLSDSSVNFIGTLNQIQNNLRPTCEIVVISCKFTVQLLSFVLFSQAWLTEIHEFSQQNVVIMLLGNKVSEPAEPLCMYGINSYIMYVENIDWKSKLMHNALFID